MSSENDSRQLNDLQLTLSHIDKMFGKGTIMLLGQNPGYAVETIPSGSVLVDHCLGMGGFPRGRIVEIYGNEGCGKTTLALHCVGEVQRRGGVCAFIDCEHALDPSYVVTLGLNDKELLISQPDNGEQAIEIVDMLIRSGKVDVVVIDSVAALTPKAEIEGSVEDQLPGSQARLMSKALRKITASISRSKAVVIFINQMRSKIGVIFGNPETTSGGNALKFYASVRVELRQGEKLKHENEFIGSVVRVKAVKNKIAPPFRQTEFSILYGKGIDRYAEIVQLALQKDILQRKGSWVFLGERKLAQGLDRVRDLLQQDPELLKTLSKVLLEKCSIRSDTLENLVQAKQQKQPKQQK